MEENKKKIKKPKKKWIVLGMLVLIVGGIGIAAAAAGAKGMPVSVVSIKTQDISQDIELTGTVGSENVETIFAQVDAVVSDVLVKDGAYVQKGAKLLTYDEEALLDAIERVELDSKATEYGADATIITINDAQGKAAKAASDYETAHAYAEHYQRCSDQLSAQLVEASVVNEKLQKKQAEIAELQGKLEVKPDSEKLKDKLQDAQKEAKKLSKEYDAYDVIHLQAALETCQGDLAEYKSQEAEYKAAKESADPAAGKQKAQQDVVKQAAQLSVEDAKEALEKAREGVSTDYSAIVSDMQVTKGQTVAAGTPLFTLSDAEKIEIKFEITKQNMSLVSEGQNATVTINGKEYEGTVSMIQKTAKTNASGATVVEASVHINNPDDAIFLGVEANIKIHVMDKQDVVVIPYDCVNYATDATFCYIVKDGMIEKREIEVGIAGADSIEVLSGLSKGEEVVSDATMELTEGMKVNKVSVPDEE